ncbi:MAG: hypothetical protein AAGH87_07035 [Pseudomonadota bacterium]
MPGASSELILAIHGFVVLEAIVLARILVRRGLSRFVPAALAFLVSGAFLMEALRAALGGAWSAPIPALLLGAFISHLACLALAHRSVRG